MLNYTERDIIDSMLKYYEDLANVQGKTLEAIHPSYLKLCDYLTALDFNENPEHVDPESVLLALNNELDPFNIKLKALAEALLDCGQSFVIYSGALERKVYRPGTACYSMQYVLMHLDILSSTAFTIKPL